MSRPLVMICFGVMLSSFAYGQGGGGRSESVRVPTSSEDRRAGRSARRTSNTDRPSAPKIRLPEMGRLAIRVSEGESQLQIFRDGNPIETINIPARSTSLIIRRLDVGTYTVAAKKMGFHDESRTVEIEKNQGRRVSIDLHPKMSILSVASNVPDAKISIGGLGDFDRPVERAFVKPGKYRITVSRRGYVSREVTVDLKTAGREERLNLIIEPLRVDNVLDLAFQRIKANKLDEAEALANDVLELNANHARANLALGRVHLGRGDTARAVDRLMKAIGGGETFSMPVEVRVEASDAKAVSAVLFLDARILRFESSERPGLNFSIARSGLNPTEIRAESLTISGQGDYHGRPITARVQVHSDNYEALGSILSEWRIRH